MPASFKCHHPERRVAVSVVQQPGEVEAFLHMQVFCDTCNGTFRFIGVDPAHDTRLPGVNRTATEIVLPMVEVV
jgi:hypothetical protein